MTRRLIRVVAIAATGVIVAALSMCAPLAAPAPAPGATSTPGPSAMLAVASPTPATSPTASPTPTPQGVYTSKALGYALELQPSWHRAVCGNSDPGDTRLPAWEDVTSAAPVDEILNDIGTPNDRVSVYVEDNPARHAPMDFAAAKDPYASAHQLLRGVTFAGRPAAEVAYSPGEDLAYYVADLDRMYTVGFNTGRPADAPAPDRAAMVRIVRSFRFLSAAEQRALPDPTSIPAAAPTLQAFAGMLAGAFQQKDAAALERLLSPCVSLVRIQAGGSSTARERYIADLRTQFANGLTVTVDTNAIRTDTLGPWSTQTYVFVRSRWNATPPGDHRPPPSPDPSGHNVDLMLSETRGGLYWYGALLVGP